MKILFFQPANKGLYYEEFLNHLSTVAQVVVYGPGYPGYDPRAKLGTILTLCPFRPDCCVIGAGWEDDANPDNFDPHPELDLSTLGNFSIPKVMILNKEYKKLDQKRDFIQKNKIDLVFTVHHHHYTWQNLFGTRVERMLFAANEEIFKDHKQIKEYDFGFSGNLFNSGAYSETDIMGPNFNNIRHRIAQIIHSDRDIDKLEKFWRPGQYITGPEYSRIMNKSKLWISTPSAIDIVGTRFFEVLGSKSLLFCKKSSAYEGIFKDGENCVMFEGDLSDFKEKLLYYIDKSNERNDIIEKGYDLFINNHTWKHRVDLFLNKVKELKK